MPELPEVETVLRGMKPHVIGGIIKKITVRNHNFRHPVPRNISAKARGQRVISLSRRAKYIVMELETGGIIIHLGMSGVIRLVDEAVSLTKHDHIDVKLDSGKILRINDPRRFGCFVWNEGTDILANKLFSSLGPEPLSADFTARYLAKRLTNKKSPIKIALMDGKTVAGVGNIYANEALFLSGINPFLPAFSLSHAQLENLVDKVKNILRKAIKEGGTTLKDFKTVDGKPGYFVQQLAVYGKDGCECDVCGNKIVKKILGQRATFFCPVCQPAVVS